MRGWRLILKKIKAGVKNVLWPGMPMYFAKTAGTTYGSKYIPITQASITNHIHGARNALLNYIYATGKADFLNGNMIFLSGSPQLHKTNGIATGRLSGIVNHHVPSYLQGSQLPSYPTNCIADWEAKLDKIIEETRHANMTLISGIPPWIQMYFDQLQEQTNKKIARIFPKLSLLVHGGVNFEPYRTQLFETIGKKIDVIETYPASEGFIAFQAIQQDPGLLLQLNSGIFFEFVSVATYGTKNSTRVSIENVEIGMNYAIIINSNAGLWGYALGDTVQFIAKNPYKIVVTGRIKHFISAFGEHVIAQEVESAMQQTLSKHSEAMLIEFTVAPYISQQKQAGSHHEWLVEFAHLPQNPMAFARDLEKHLQRLNPYYNDLIQGKILTNLQLTVLAKNAFRNYMQGQGKLGGQNKVPRLANDRNIADALLQYKI